MSSLTVHLNLTFGTRSLGILAVCGLIAALAPELASENVTLTTYYPAPSGVYTQMITTSNSYLARDGGKVGIGTITPAAKLEVVGTTILRGRVSIVDGTQAAGKVLTAINNSGDAQWDVVTPTLRQNNCAWSPWFGTFAPSGETYKCPVGRYVAGMNMSWADPGGSDADNVRLYCCDP